MAIGMGISAASTMFAGFAKADSMRDQAVQNRIAAVWARIKAEDDANIIRDQGDRFQANQAVGFAKSGVLIDSGSPLATLMDTAIRVERNALRTVMHGSREAYNYETTASSLMKGADNMELAGIFGGVAEGIKGYTGMQTLYEPPKKGVTP